VLLVCDEVGTVLPDPRDLSTRLDEPRCVGDATVSDFVNATSDQIQAVGFTPDQYR